MIYNEYGKTGIKVSAIGMGGMRFENQEDPEACASLMKAAYDSGINYFDTAIGYGKSEELFGIAIKEMLKTRSKKPFYIATKTGGGTAEAVRKDLEVSLKRMNLDYIDFYHVWCIMSLDKYRERVKNGVIRELEKMKAEGLVKHICVSTHMAGADIKTLLSDYPFDGLLLGYSIMNFAYRTEGVQAAADAKMGVVAMNPLGGGLIPQNPEQFNFVKTRDDETVVEGALRFLLNDKRLTVSLVGLSNKKQLEEAISAADGFRPISKKDISSIREKLKKSFNELCTNCGYCDSCPEKIPVPRMMDAYNHYLLNKKNPDSMINRFKWHWGIDIENEYFTKCTQCGLCEKKCTQKLPIRERLKTIRKEVEIAREKKKAS
ncbi:MAG TPA: aldo/keto reductase [Lentisphaeria bacterium]|nr:MAG: hypothetical protein A2X48_21235 [Lentisphaerae bacterium GWF2_49_21]HBC87775.1 aldo/keto reductase [Lentisphaeria bacterium]